MTVTKPGPSQTPKGPWVKMCGGPGFGGVGGLRRVTAWQSVAPWPTLTVSSPDSIGFTRDQAAAPCAPKTALRTVLSERAC